MQLLSRVALGLLGLSFGSSLACQMSNPAFDLADAGETRATGDDLSSSGESNSSIGDGDGDTQTGDGDGDGDPTTGDGDPTTGDGDPTTGDGDPTTGDGDPTTGDGDPTAGDGDGDGDTGLCGDGNVDPGEECDDGNPDDGDMCNPDCSLPEPDPDTGVEMCAMIFEPATCADCLNTFCCNEDGLACAASEGCMCMFPCLADMGLGPDCANECNADENLLPFAEATLACAQQHCPVQCFSP